MPSSSSADNPHRVVVLLTEGLVLMDMAAPVQLFGHVGAPRYALSTCTEYPGPVPTCAGVSVHTEHGLEALADADTIVIPGYHDAARRTPSRTVTAALRQAHRRGARIASICVGAFTLAESGLLDGRRATTHWLDAAALAARYPAVEVDPSVLYVDDGDVLTSAGLAAGIDLCLHLVERDYGADVARDYARRTVVAFHRPGGQAQFMPPGAAPRSPQVSLHDQAVAEINHQAMISAQESDDRMAATTGWAVANLADPIGVADLADHAGMSLRTFNRRFRDTYGMSPGRWLTGQRIRVAAQLLERTDLPVEQVAAAVGLGTESLRVQFRSRMSLSPSAYRSSFRVTSG
ncbi:ThiJ/PfpI domain protein [Gordonia bronchialis DSM 43247]|uniref:ThiJ/PfpI domain protein n=2 Tax=Gordonia bronchialis TaxID=2054 RepID=D0LEB2_GORB4|nr:ThiJ/PfpI domain protein [Gordonia bronchialis DSM 43247]QGS27233.1 helix-turn-helix domain-containing protein [Gordonia bronchialis]STQ62608.1 HTH-type transcriptional repressor of iron proteins A [Gordonia bronchialis]